jgi:hypothetical protein
MREHDRSGVAYLARVDAVLRPYAWKRMTVHAVARRLVEEIDGNAAATDDGRVWIVERALSGCRWRGLTVAGVARQAAAALESWDASLRRIDLELARLLDADDS